MSAEPLIVAHRGASHDAPENTLAAFKLGWEQGADAIEGDFLLTADGVVVAVHDKDMKRTGGKKIAVATATYAELATLDVGSWKDPKFKGERVPTLPQVLATIPDGKFLLLEVKCGPEIMPAIKRDIAGREHLVRIIAFNAEVIAAARRQLPAVQAYWITNYKRKAPGLPYKPSFDTVMRTLKECRAHGLDCNAHNIIDEAFVKRLRDAGLAFHVWTVDDPEVARRFRALGVDSLTTNRPAWLRSQLEPK